jgi:hypothetical protein
MSVLSTKTKVRVGAKAAKQAAKHPKLLLRGGRAATPIVRHQAKAKGRRAVQQAGKVPGSQTAPRVVAGVAVGAVAMYFLDPASGARRRRRVLELLKRGDGRRNETAAGQDLDAGGPAHPAPGHLPPDPRPDAQRA